ncbi:mucin-2-like isoform X3 [Halichondria panicea]|uniref:mucin-2-like isoform X3 n=1 Tax=Halichondria panicea TaxID=6063 RepID=UPI00312BBF79
MASVSSSNSSTKRRCRGLLSTVNFKSVQRTTPSGPPPGIDMSSIVPSVRPSGLGRGILNTGEGRRRVKSATCSEVHVDNIPASTFERVLQKKFCRAGHVEEVRIIRSSNSKTTYGFVRFSRFSEAEEAVRIMNGVLLDGKQLVVTIAKSRSRATQAVSDPFSATSSEGETHSSKEEIRQTHDKGRIVPTLLSKTTVPSNTNCTSIARTKSYNNASPPTLSTSTTNKSPAHSDSEHIIPVMTSPVTPLPSLPVCENGDCKKVNQTPSSLETATQPSDAKTAGMPPLEVTSYGRGFSRLLISKDKSLLQQRKSSDTGTRTMSSPKPGRIGRGKSLLQLVQQHHTLPQEEDVVSSSNEFCETTKPELTLSDTTDSIDSASTERLELPTLPPTADSCEPPTMVNIDDMVPPEEDIPEPPTMVDIEVMVPPTEDSSGPPKVVNIDAKVPPTEDSSEPPTIVNIDAMGPPTVENSEPPTVANIDAMVPPTEDISEPPTDDEVHPTTVDTDSAIEDLQFELPILDTSDLLTLPSQLFEFNRSEFFQLPTAANDPPLCDKPEMEQFLTEGKIEIRESERSQRSTDNNEQSHNEASLSVTESSLTSSGKKMIKMAAVFPSSSTPLKTTLVSKMPAQTEFNNQENMSDIEQDLPVMAEVEIQSSKNEIDESLSTDVVVEDYHGNCDLVGIEGDMVDQVSALLSNNIEIGSVQLEVASVGIVHNLDLEMNLSCAEDETTSPVPSCAEDKTTFPVPSCAEDETTFRVPSCAEDETTSPVRVPSCVEDETTSPVPSCAEDETTSPVPSCAEDETTSPVPSCAEDETTSPVPSCAEDETTFPVRVPSCAEDETTSPVRVPSCAEGETTSPVRVLNEIASDEESSEDEGSGVGTRGRGRDEVEKSIATYQRNTHRWQTDLKRLQMKIVAMETGLEERHTEHAQTEVGPLEELSDQRQIELDTIARLESQYILREEQTKMSALRRQQTLETIREQYSGDRTGLLEVCTRSGDRTGLLEVRTRSGDRTGLLEIELAIENEEARAKLELTKLKLKVLQLKEELYATLDS